MGDGDRFLAAPYGVWGGIWRHIPSSCSWGVGWDLAAPYGVWGGRWRQILSSALWGVGWDMETDS